MEAIGDHVGAILIAVVSAAGTVLVTLLKARGDKSMSVPGQYQGLMQEVKDWANLQLEQRDRTIESLRNDDKERDQRIDQLESRVDSLQDEVRKWKRKFFLAVEYIRIIRRSVENRDLLPPVPDHLRDDIDN